MAQGGLLEAERVVGAASSLDATILTAKLGVGAVAAKSLFDFFTDPRTVLVLEVAGAAAVLALLVSLVRAAQGVAGAAKGVVGAAQGIAGAAQGVAAKVAAGD